MIHNQNYYDKYGAFSGQYFPVFGLNTEIYGVNLRIQSEYREIRTRKNSVFGHFSRSAMFLVIAMVEFKRDFCTDCSKLISAVLKIYNPT